MRRNTILCLGFVLTAFSQPVSAGMKVTPIGAYEKVQADEEHTYGHRLLLWKDGKRLIGQLTYWGWDVEGQSGDFIDGSYDPKTGDVKFKVTVIRHDVQPNERHAAAFEGRLRGNVLKGTLRWEKGQSGDWEGEEGVEKLALKRAKKYSLRSFQSIQAWQEAELERYDQKD